MSRLYEIVNGETSIGPFYSWQDARAFQAAHCEPGVVKSYLDPMEAEDFASNPEPQEMTSKWANAMRRAM